MKGPVRFLSVFFLSASLFTVGCMGPAADDSSAAVGDLDETQFFILPDLNGENVSLESLLKENKAVLINFWATWCPPCREEIPDLIKLQDKYKDRGFMVLGVDVGESNRKVSSFVQEFGINYPVVLDGDMEVARIYDLVGIPTTLLINREGKVLGTYHAYTKKLVADVEKALQ